MATIHHDADADLAALDGATLAVVGYGNQGRSWALNLRDSGLTPQVCVRADASREQARDDGFATAGLEAASDADVVCLLVPDDAIPRTRSLLEACLAKDPARRLRSAREARIALEQSEIAQHLGKTLTIPLEHTVVDIVNTRRLSGIHAHDHAELSSENLESKLG